MRKTYRKLSDVFEDLVGRNHLFTKTKVLSIRSRWLEVVGESIGSRTKVVDFDGRTLTVSVQDGTWMYELKMREKKLIRDINKAVGHDLVKALRFIVTRR